MQAGAGQPETAQPETVQPETTRPKAQQPGLTEPETEPATESWQRRGSSFGAAAAQYAEHRPGYAETAIRWCLAPVTGARVSGARPVRVADLGAGTGILAGALARLGADVVAVEPDQAMLAELRR